MNTDDAPAYDVLQMLRMCAMSWRPEARIIGDIRAGDIVRATNEAIEVMQSRRENLRELTEHRVNPANDKLRIEVTDAPGAGGANHVYLISIEDGKRLLPLVQIQFQNGPINEAGVNGVTQEALLAIIADRLRSFQKGPFTCRENSLALTKIEEAQHWLHARTTGRMARGVEGTHKP